MLERIVQIDDHSGARFSYWGGVAFEPWQKNKESKMKLSLLIICSLIFICPGVLSAELYKYYDEKGALCFTDDFSMVPPNQRLKVEALHEIQTKPDVSEDDGTENESNSREANEVDLKLDLEQELKQLEAIKKELDDEYLLLKDRQNQLISEAQEKMDSEQTRAYNQRVNTLNQDALKYKEKQQAYFQKFEIYNLKLKSVQ